MSDYLDQIEARHAEISKHAGLGKSQRRMLDAMFEPVKDVPRLLAAVRAVEAIADELCEDIPEDAANASMKHAGKVIRRALTEALEGER